MEIVDSINGIPIRLTSERWFHVVENHDEMAGKFHVVLETVAEPDLIAEGRTGEFMAIKLAKPVSIVVIYREVLDRDGFVITAFQTTKLKQLVKNRKLIWKRPRSRKS